MHADLCIRKRPLLSISSAHFFSDHYNTLDSVWKTRSSEAVTGPTGNKFWNLNGVQTNHAYAQCSATWELHRTRRWKIIPILPHQLKFTWIKCRIFLPGWWDLVPWHWDLSVRPTSNSHLSDLCWGDKRNSLNESLVGRERVSISPGQHLCSYASHSKNFESTCNMLFTISTPQRCRVRETMCAYGHECAIVTEKKVVARAWGVLCMYFWTSAFNVTMNFPFHLLLSGYVHPEFWRTQWGIPSSLTVHWKASIHLSQKPGHSDLDTKDRFFPCWAHWSQGADSCKTSKALTLPRWLDASRKKQPELATKLCPPPFWVKLTPIPVWDLALNL